MKINLKMFGWDEVTKDISISTGKTEFTKLTNGITELRFLDKEPFARWAHWLPNAKRNISCVGAGCPVCEAIKSAKSAKIKSPYNSNRKFAMHVYNVTTGNVEVLEQGKTFFTQLHALHEEVGDITEYNIKIKTQNAGSTDVVFTLMPLAKTELTDEIKEKCKDLKAFEDIFKVPTRDQVIQLMNGVAPEVVFGNQSSETDSDDEIIEVGQ